MAVHLGRLSYRRIKLGALFARAPRGRPRSGPLSSPRENSIHQSSCQTKSLDKEGEKSTNEKVGMVEEDKVGQEGRPSGTVCVRCVREKNLLFGKKGIKGLEFL